MLTSDLYHSDALNYLMLFFPDQIANFYNFRKVYSRSSLFTISQILICIIQALTVQLITVTQKPYFHLSVSTRMILCQLLHELCYSLRSLKLGTRPWYSTGPYPKLFTGQYSMTCAMKVSS